MNRRTLAGLAVIVPFLFAVMASADEGAGVPASDAPTVLSLAPAVLAIVLALVTRQVLVSLLGGVWLGAAILSGPLAAFPATVDTAVRVVVDADKIKVISFTLLMGGMVGVITAAGGTRGIVGAVSKIAKTRRSASLAAWAMGMFVFFDDYASTLLVGNTMRPITDRVRVSREKLSYIVDSTAAPIASLALASTWIGYEISVFADALGAAGLEANAYSLFIEGLSSRYYPIFALVFVGMVAWSGRDFGSMYEAERRAAETGQLIRPGASPLMDAEVLENQKALADVEPRLAMAVAPIATLIGTIAAVSAFHIHRAFSSEACAESFSCALRDGLGAAGYDALLYGASLGTGLALVMGFATRVLDLTRGTDALVNGIRSMTLAVLVLVLAWSIGDVMKSLHAGDYVASLLGPHLPAWLLPTLTFVLAAGMALATGTSWGTMAILFPIVIPIVAMHQAEPGFHGLLVASASAVLAGAVFGDHCSPISDTTVLSSIASASDHVDHTRTQLPYAIVCGIVSIVAGTVPAGLGVSPWISLAVGLGLLWGCLRFLGRSVD